MAFISPQFLFPNNTGGRIRTTNILRGLKGGAFEVTLLLPATEDDRLRWSTQLASVSDRALTWRPAAAQSRWLRVFDLLGRLPINVAADRQRRAIATVRQTIAREPFDIAIFDFVHSAVLLPPKISCPTVCFTHNVEAEIFARHAAHARNVLMRSVWSHQYTKMRRYESEALRRFDGVIAVSERDKTHFETQYKVRDAFTIPTGVDLNYFEWRSPGPVDADHPPTAVFVGSMDWDANVDGVSHFLDLIWPIIQSQIPDARFIIVGRHPPASMIERARALQGVTVTGFVEDIRPYVRAAHVAVIPLRVGGGTRIKAYEAMAMGCPVVSTSIGIEGLDVIDGEHYLRRDGAPEQAEAVVALMRDASLRRALSQRARQHVESRFGYRAAAAAFEDACMATLSNARKSSEPLRLFGAAKR